MAIILPSVISEDCWFYKANESLCKPHLGKYYISYSTASSWFEYRDDFIKQKIAGITLPEGIYGKFGSYVGHFVEHGEFPLENPHGFTGQENLSAEDLRPDGAEYEKMILIDRGEYCIIGFIDIYHEYEQGVVRITDNKTGGKGKESTYKKPEYVQVILYAYAIEQLGKTVGKTDVMFIRREGSHINPPLHISKERFSIPLEYSPERVKYALEKMDKAVNEISDLYKTYKKYFSDGTTECV